MSRRAPGPRIFLQPERSLNIDSTLRGGARGAELRGLIEEAHSAGDVLRLRALQREYRALPLIRREQRVATPAYTVKRTSWSAEAVGVDVDDERVVTGILMRLGTVVLASNVDGEVVRSLVKRNSLARWFESVDPLMLRAAYNHDPKSPAVGRWLSFELLSIADQEVLTGSLELERGRRGDELLTRLDRDPSMGFSVHFESTSWVHQPMTARRDLLVFDGGDLDVRECGVVEGPADPMCIALTVAGHRPRWREMEAVQDRALALRARGVA